MAIEGLQGALVCGLKKKGLDMPFEATGAFGPHNNGQGTRREPRSRNSVCAR